MARSALIERVTFAGGELAPTAAARSDFGRYQTSVDKLENFIVLQEGGLTRRPGTRFVLEAKDQAQLARHIPFRYSTEDFYTLILNGGKARIVRSGGFVQNPDTSPYEFDIPWAEAQLRALRFARDGNVLYVVSPDVQPYTVTRTSHQSWAVAAFTPLNGPVGDQNLDVAKTVVASAGTGNVTLTGVGDPFTAAMVGQVMRLDDRDLSLTPAWRTTETAIAQNARRRYNGRVYQAQLAGFDGGAIPPEHIEGDVSAGADRQTWRFLYEDHGFVRLTGFTNVNSVAATVLKRLPDTIVTGSGFSPGPTYRWHPPAWSSALGWPSAICFHSPRLALARGPDVWLTGLDGSTDFDAGLAEDDRSIVGKLKSPDTSLVDIQWMLSIGVLMLGTVDIEWVLRGPNVFDALTPTNVRAIPEGTDGAAFIEPVGVDGGAMFAGKTRQRLHHARYLRDEQKIASVELSRFARHIFAKRLAGCAWQRDPHRLLWLWFDDGSIASMSYVPTEELLAFARHPMENAFVEEISCVPSTAGGTDEVTLTVRREINGATRRYIEQFVDYFQPLDPEAPTAEGAWFVDSGLRVTGVNMTQITQLVHLAGQEVAVMADGAMQSRKIVDATGKIALDRPSNDVTVGLPIRATVRDLPRNVQAAGVSTRGSKKTIHQALLQFYQTAGADVRVYSAEYGQPGIADPDLWEKLIETGAQDYAAAPPLLTGSRKLAVPASLANEAQLELRAEHALPVTILALCPVLSIEEGVG